MAICFQEQYDDIRKNEFISGFHVVYLRATPGSKSMAFHFLGAGTTAFLGHRLPAWGRTLGIHVRVFTLS